MGQVIALIPARSGSKGVSGKNFRKLGGIPLFTRAALVGREVCDTVVISSDLPIHAQQDAVRAACRMRFLLRPDELAQDDTPMVEVVRHALAQVPGADDDIWLILQPTAVFRTPARIREAIALMRETDVDSVVSVVPVHPTLHPLWQCEINRYGELEPWPGKGYVEGYWFDRPTRRQELSQTYKPDGTVYAFTREAFIRCRSFFGSTVRPLILDPSETCELDTPEDWTALEARWRTERG